MQETLYLATALTVLRSENVLFRPILLRNAMSTNHLAVRHILAHSRNFLMSLSVTKLLKYAVPSVFWDSKKLQNNFASEILEYSYPTWALIPRKYEEDTTSRCLLKVILFTTRSPLLEASPFLTIELYSF